jgi:hypothetical protein
VVIPVVILVVVAASLTADFARWEIGSVNIRVSGLREYRLREALKSPAVMCCPGTASGYSAATRASDEGVKTLLWCMYFLNAHWLEPY